MKKVFALLERIERTPGMYLGDTSRDGFFPTLELFLYGYDACAAANGLSDEEFLAPFGSYLARAYGWGMSTGPIGAIRRNSNSEAEALTRLWELIKEFKLAGARHRAP